MSEHENPKERLSKLMAEQGFCSRREADAFIEKGWVYVDGVCINTLGTKISRQQKITLAPQAESCQQQIVTILLHKPVGYVSGQPEKNYQPAVQLITKNNYAGSAHAPFRFHPLHLSGLAPAGRLDIDSEGLLVLTQDGRIARHLIGADSEVEKEYLVRVSSHITSERIHRLRHGLSLDGKPLLPAKVEQLNPDCIQIILIEGRKRQIRRMCQLVGLEVMKLKRVRIGKVMLGSLPLGKWRYLGRNESF